VADNRVSLRDGLTLAAWLVAAGWCVFVILRGVSL